MLNSLKKLQILDLISILHQTIFVKNKIINFRYGFEYDKDACSNSEPVTSLLVLIILKKLVAITNLKLN